MCIYEYIYILLLSTYIYIYIIYAALKSTIACAYTNVYYIYVYKH